MKAKYEIVTTIPGGKVDLYAHTWSSYVGSPATTNRSHVGRFNTLQLAQGYCREVYRDRGMTCGWTGLPVRGTIQSTPVIDISSQP